MKLNTAQGNSKERKDCRKQHRATEETWKDDSPFTQEFLLNVGQEKKPIYNSVKLTGALGVEELLVVAAVGEAAGKSQVMHPIEGREEGL